MTNKKQIDVVPTRKEILDQKLKELEGVANVITLYARRVTIQEKQKIDELNESMENELAELVVESKIQEADIKIRVMRQVADLVKSKKLLVYGK